MRDFGAPAWLHTRRALTQVRDTWRAVRPLTEWLGANVGANVGTNEAPPATLSR